MTIVGLGIDLAKISRIQGAFERHGDRLLNRLFTASERAYCDPHRERFSRYAARLAAKEATIKALATNWTAGVRWIDIEVERQANQAPTLKLHGAVSRIARELGVNALHLALTHDAGIASAVVVAERSS